MSMYDLFSVGTQFEQPKGETTHTYICPQGKKDCAQGDFGLHVGDKVSHTYNGATIQGEVTAVQQGTDDNKDKWTVQFEERWIHPQLWWPQVAQTSKSCQQETNTRKETNWPHLCVKQVAFIRHQLQPKVGAICAQEHLRQKKRSCVGRMHVEMATAPHENGTGTGFQRDQPGVTRHNRMCMCMCMYMWACSLSKNAQIFPMWASPKARSHIVLSCQQRSCLALFNIFPKGKYAQQYRALLAHTIRFLQTASKAHWMQCNFAFANCFWFAQKLHKPVRTCADYRCSL